MGVAISFFIDMVALFGFFSHINPERFNDIYFFYQTGGNNGEAEAIACG
jgi:hypothetical protein